MRRYTIFRIHKYSGLAVGLILGLLAITGFFLDHENFDFLWEITLDDQWLPESMVSKKPRGIEAYRVDPADPRHIMVGSRRGLFVSEDGGNTFARTLARQTLAIDTYRKNGEEDYQHIFAATTDGIYSSSDGGRQWQSLALSGSPVTGLNTYQGMIYAVLDRRELYRIDPQQGIATPLPMEPIAPEQLGKEIKLGRLVRDLHYGRGLFSGDSSLLINDFLAILLLFLSIGGFVIYFKVRKIRRHKLGKTPSLTVWLRTHSHGSGLAGFLLVFVIFGITGVFLDHSSTFRNFLKNTHLNTSWLPPVYRDLSTDIWGFDFDGSHYRIGNRLGVYRSTDLKHWQQESSGFAWRMKRLQDQLLVSGMGSPNLVLRNETWEKLQSTPHMPRDFYLKEGELGYLSMGEEELPLPQWKSTSLYHIMLGLHDGELLWGQWVWINDIAVLGLLLLLITGFIKWRHHRRKRRS